MSRKPPKNIGAKTFRRKPCPFCGVPVAYGKGIEHVKNDCTNPPDNLEARLKRNGAIVGNAFLTVCNIDGRKKRTPEQEAAVKFLADLGAFDTVPKPEEKSQ